MELNGVNATSNACKSIIAPISIALDSHFEPWIKTCGKTLVTIHSPSLLQEDKGSNDYFYFVRLKLTFLIYIKVTKIERGLQIKQLLELHTLQLNGTEAMCLIKLSKPQTLPVDGY